MPAVEVMISDLWWEVGLQIQWAARWFLSDKNGEYMIVHMAHNGWSHLQRYYYNNRVRVNSIKVDGGIFHEVVRYSIPVNVALSRIKVTPVCRIWSHNTYSMLEQSNILDDKQNLTGSKTCLYIRVSYEKNHIDFQWKSVKSCFPSH